MRLCGSDGVRIGWVYVNDDVNAPSPFSCKNIYEHGWFFFFFLFNLTCGMSFFFLFFFISYLKFCNLFRHFSSHLSEVSLLKHGLDQYKERGMHLVLIEIHNGTLLKVCSVVEHQLIIFTFYHVT